MSWLEMPSPELWHEREQWFSELNESIEGEGSYLVSDQACALIGEIQTCFCAGAWIAVIVLAISVIDAQLRETELPGYKGNTKELFDIIPTNPELHNLRKKRNSIVHLNIERPAIDVDQQWANQIELEQEARQAIKLMLEAFYSSPSV